MFLSYRKFLRLALPTAFAAGSLTLAAPAAHANFVYTNITSSNDGTDTVFEDGPLAQSFNSGQGGALSTIDLLLQSSTAEDPAGLLQVSLVADNNTSPGATLISLGTLQNSAVTAGLQIFQFYATSPYILAANTTYWVEISETTPNGIEWSYSLDQTATGVATQYFSDQEFGVTADNAGYGAFQMSVQVPEPATSGLVVAGCVGLGLLRRRRVMG